MLCIPIRIELSSLPGKMLEIIYKYIKQLEQSMLLSDRPDLYDIPFLGL